MVRGELTLEYCQISVGPMPHSSGDLSEDFYDKEDPYTRRKDEPRSVYQKSYCFHIKCPSTTFLAAFMWKRPLNSVTLATATHRGPEKVADGTGAQVATPMVDRWTTKIA